jgi:hypothetical protein
MVTNHSGDGDKGKARRTTTRQPSLLAAREDRPHPPISNGTSQAKAKSSSQEAASEGCISPMTSSGTVLFRPNNYRRRIRVSDIPNDLVRAHPPLTPFISYGKGNKHRFIKGLYLRVTLQVAKNTITAIYDQRDEKGEKETFVVDRKGGVKAKADEIIRMLDSVLADFCTKVGIVSLGPVQTSWHEDGLRGEKFIDGLPKEMIIQAGKITKLYGEGVEFKGDDEPAVMAERYLRNAALLELAPMIAEAIRELGSRAEHKDAFMMLQAMLNEYPGDFLSREVKRLIGELSAHEKDMLSDWTFERFGGR